MLKGTGGGGSSAGMLIGCFLRKLTHLFFFDRTKDSHQDIAKFLQGAFQYCPILQVRRLRFKAEVTLGLQL